MKWKVIKSFDERRIAQLMELYRSVWWANTRQIQEVRLLIKHTTVNIGCVDPKNDQLIGFVRAISDQVCKAVIFDVIVHTDYQGQGLGKSLMQLILGHPLVKSAEHIELYCLDDKMAFYEKIGFQNMNTKINYMRFTQD